MDIAGVNGTISPISLFRGEGGNSALLAGLLENLLNVNIPNNLIKTLDSIHYDSMSASIIWQNRTNFTLDNFIIIGDNLRIISSGKLIGGTRVPLSECDVYFESQINTKNDLMDIFDKLGLASGGYDYYGYKIGPQIVVRGTVGKPDFGGIKKILASAAAKMLLEKDIKDKSPSVFDPTEVLMKVFRK
jgi:hypothetical protein